MSGTRVRRGGMGKALVMLVAAVTAVVGTGVWSLVSADPNGPAPADRRIASMVTMLMRSDHLLGHPLDDEISARGFDSFLESLDPWKIYFTKADIDEFSASRMQLDDMLRNKDLSFGHRVFQRFLQRVDERVALAQEILDNPLDFTRDESIVIERDLLDYPQDDDEVRDRWRKRIKYDILVLKDDETDEEEARDRLRRRYTSFARRMHQFTNDELLELYLNAFTTSYDPHTTYMSPSSFENFQISMSLQLDGIGAQLQDRDGEIVVANIIRGGAADRQGDLKPEDRIVGVDEAGNGEIMYVDGMRLNDVVDMIRGERGTDVRLAVMPAEGGDETIITITRERIELQDEAATGEVFEAGQKPDGSPFRIGVIELPSFYLDMEAARRGDPNARHATHDVQVILENFKDEEVDAVVLDLRRNGGGSLSEAISMTGLFIERGPVVQVQGPTDPRPMQFNDPLPGMGWDGPLVVMTNKLSASASEILAGAIQDYRRGLIVGDDATHGKGTVQDLLDLRRRLLNSDDGPNLGALKITKQQFYRPNGDSTQKRGVLSDIVLPSITNFMDVAESDLDYAIEFDQVERAFYTPSEMLTDQMIDALRSRSEGRREQSEDFNRLLERIERYVEQKTRTSVTLVEEEFIAERERMDAERAEAEEFEEDDDEDGILRDYYLDEVLAITVDYARMLREAGAVAAN